MTGITRAKTARRSTPANDRSALIASAQRGDSRGVIDEPPMPLVGAVMGVARAFRMPPHALTRPARAALARAGQRLRGGRLLSLPVPVHVAPSRRSAVGVGPAARRDTTGYSVPGASELSWRRKGGAGRPNGGASTPGLPTIRSQTKLRVMAPSSSHSRVCSISSLSLMADKRRG